MCRGRQRIIIDNRRRYARGKFQRIYELPAALINQVHDVIVTLLDAPMNIGIYYTRYVPFVIRNDNVKLNQRCVKIIFIK